eukprot:TRINITY_DN2094_c1_g6_i1.p1 TRINITY_DN2094_c1_g6~~TRINITY_DN2094_c1_g6_i1.p1  ORF type:complete len:333 (+),score=79.91 TRINITY_DN2094_c1_g6_i1:48-1046(+)
MHRHARPLLRAAGTARRIERITSAATEDALLTAIGTRPLKEAEVVAALHQAAVVAANWEAEGQGAGPRTRDVVDEVMARAGADVALTDNVYRAMLQAYVLFGKMAEGKQAYACIDDVTPADIGAGMMAAAGEGDYAWAAELWREAERQGLARPVEAEGGEDAAEALEVLTRHFLAALLRGKQPKKFEAAARHATDTLRVHVAPATLSHLILAAPSPASLRLVWDTLAGAGGVVPSATHYSASVWRYVTSGDPLAALDLYEEALDGGHASLPLHCAAVEAYLTLFHHLPRGNAAVVGDARAALEAAVAGGATAEWAALCRTALAAVESAEGKT